MTHARPHPLKLESATAPVMLRKLEIMLIRNI